MDQNEIYIQLVEDCKSIIGESGYKQNVNTLESRWELGQAIADVNDEMDRRKIYGLSVIDNLSRDLGSGFSARNLRYCVQFYKKYKEYKTFGNVLPNLPEGKNTTWRDMCEKYLRSAAEDAQEAGRGQDRPPRSAFRLNEIEDAFKNFAIDILAIRDLEEREDQWEKFKEYFT
ncbi:MAG: DUF1016 N-terminal domain-containing protein [Patescibacteria group bacterium]|jgi:hypothetical protein